MPAMNIQKETRKTKATQLPMEIHRLARLVVQPHHPARARRRSVHQLQSLVAGARGPVVRIDSVVVAATGSMLVRVYLERQLVNRGTYRRGSAGARSRHRRGYGWCHRRSSGGPGGGNRQPPYRLGRPLAAIETCKLRDGSQARAPLREETWPHEVLGARVEVLDRHTLFGHIVHLQRIAWVEDRLCRNGCLCAGHHGRRSARCRDSIESLAGWLWWRNGNLTVLFQWICSAVCFPGLLGQWLPT